MAWQKEFQSSGMLVFALLLISNVVISVGQSSRGALATAAASSSPTGPDLDPNDGSGSPYRDPRDKHLQRQHHQQHHHRAQAIAELDLAEPAEPELFASIDESRDGHKPKAPSKSRGRSKSDHKRSHTGDESLDAGERRVAASDGIYIDHDGAGGGGRVEREQAAQQVDALNKLPSRGGRRWKTIDDEAFDSDEEEVLPGKLQTTSSESTGKFETFFFFLFKMEKNAPTLIGFVRDFFSLHNSLLDAPHWWS